MIRTLLTAFLAAVLAAPALAQDARFLIERIEVRNAKRVSPQLVVSETLLREGAEYSEAELSAAASRLARLPFLLSADFALERGSDRGRHVLVITVSETKPFFFLIDARAIVNDDRGQTQVDYTDPANGEHTDAALGFRWFVGGRGILHLGLASRNDPHGFTGDYAAPSIGYTRYDLFGTGAFATVNIRLPWARYAEGTISPQIVIGAPLTTSQTLTFEYEDTHFRNDEETYFGVEVERRDAERRLALAWTYNTTNQPFVPTRGTIVRVSPFIAMRDVASVRFPRMTAEPTVPQAYARHNTAYGLDLTVSRYWELSERHSVSAGVLAGWARAEQRLNAATSPSEAAWNPTFQIVRGTYSRAVGRGASRLELDGRMILRQLNVDRGEELFGAVDRETTVLQTSVNWVRRSSWGTLRLGVGYAVGE